MGWRRGRGRGGGAEVGEEKGGGDGRPTDLYTVDLLGKKEKRKYRILTAWLVLINEMLFQRKD